VTQQAVEQALGKLVADEEFRVRFFTEPAQACRDAGLVLSAVELEALARLPREALDRFGEDIDARISRPCLDPGRLDTHDERRTS
jgi:hypothetical protein